MYVTGVLPVPVVDLILAALALATAAWGYRHGLMARPLMVVGFAVGAVMGWRAAPPVLGVVLPEPYGPVLAGPVALLCGVLLAIGLERAVLALRRRLRDRGRLEALGAAFLATLLGLVAIWAIAALGTRVDALRGPVNDSAIVSGVNAVVSPGSLAQAEASDPPGTEADGAPARANIKRDPEIAAARASVVRVEVAACGSGSVGSGWIAGDGVVVTNAHVVAGSELISVQLGGEGARHAAEAVFYDEDIDIAVLRSPGLRGAPALEIDLEAKRGAPLAMLGFPDGGPYTVKPAQLGISSKVPGLRVGEDYVERRVTRLIANARPGNSGGPLVGQDGRVAGVVFASGGYTAYAVLASTVRRALERAEGPVDTGACDDEEPF